jgi:hypothetical protein
MLIPGGCRQEEALGAGLSGFRIRPVGSGELQSVKKAQPDVEFVTEQAPLSARSTPARSQALDDAAGRDPTCCSAPTCRNSFARAIPWRVHESHGGSLLTGEPEYLDPLKDEPVGWIVTGYPGTRSRPRNTPPSSMPTRRNTTTIPGRLDRRLMCASARRRHRRPARRIPRSWWKRSRICGKPVGPFTHRASDHQATMGAYVGTIALEGGKGVMVDFRSVDGATVLPSDAEVKSRVRPRRTKVSAPMSWQPLPRRGRGDPFMTSAHSFSGAQRAVDRPPVLCRRRLSLIFGVSRIINIAHGSPYARPTSPTPSQPGRRCVGILGSSRDDLLSASSVR